LVLVQIWVFNQMHVAYRDKKVVGVFIAFFVRQHNIRLNIGLYHILKIRICILAER
jgi:hypothetical protein